MILDVMCTNVCVEPILISLYPILTDFVMMLVSPLLMIYHQSTQSGRIRFLYNLPLPRVCLYWQTVQTPMRRRILRRLIWDYAVCICSL